VVLRLGYCVRPQIEQSKGHYVALLGKTLNSHGASLHPGVHVEMGTSEFYAEGNPAID